MFWKLSFLSRFKEHGEQGAYCIMILVFHWSVQTGILAAQTRFYALLCCCLSVLNIPLHMQQQYSLYAIDLRHVSDAYRYKVSSFCVLGKWSGTWVGVYDLLLVAF